MIFLPSRFSPTAHGQSLAEFAIGFSVLLLVMVTGAYMGLGMYYGQMASDAIREITMEKRAMADDPGGYSAADLANIINTSNVKGNIGSGSLLDPGSVKVVKDGQPTAIVVGQKSYNAMGIPLVFTVSQGIQKNLLAANTGAKLGVGWANPPGKPPWTNPAFNGGGRTIPAIVECSPSSSASISDFHAMGLGGDDGTYLGAKQLSLTSPVSEKTTLMLAKQEMGDCASAGGSCQAEYNALLPKEKSKDVYGDPPRTIQYSFYNPPGAPGKTAWIMVSIDSETGQPSTPGEADMVTLNTSDNLTGDQGFYIDPSGEYKKPPGNFVENCKKRKQAQCALEAAVKRGKAIAAAYKEECTMQ